MSEMRADRLLTVSGRGSRSEVKKIIRAVGRRMKEKMREDQAALSRAGNGPGGTGSEGNGSGETGAGGTGA